MAVVGLSQILSVSPAATSITPLTTKSNNMASTDTASSSNAGTSQVEGESKEANAKSSDEDKSKVISQASAPASQAAAAPTLQSGGVRFVSGPAGAGRDAAGFIQVGVLRGGILWPRVLGR